MILELYPLSAVRKSSIMVVCNIALIKLSEVVFRDFRNDDSWSNRKVVDIAPAVVQGDDHPQPYQQLVKGEVIARLK